MFLKDYSPLTVKTLQYRTDLLNTCQESWNILRNYYILHKKQMALMQHIVETVIQATVEWKIVHSKCS